jgi:hypothetical protein
MRVFAARRRVHVREQRSIVVVAAQMNNHCPSQWPNYERCPASNPQCC